MSEVLTEPRLYRFSQEEYDQMGRLGWFAGQAAELAGGEVLVRPGEGAPSLARRWTRDEYIQMSELGWFVDRRVELIAGEVIEMPAQYDIHAAAIDLTRDALRLAFGSGHWV